MKKASTFAVTIAILLTGLTPAKSTAQTAVAVTPTTVQAAPAPQVPQVIHTDSPELMALGEWALGRYTEAGLELPTIDLYFHDNSDPCKGYSALHTRTDNHSLINICSTSRTPKVESTILHEIGHSWAAHNLTDYERQAFVELQGLDAWHDKDISWNDRGTEHAAEIIAWGLGETSRLPRWIPNNDLDSLTTAYQQLTGTDPITDTTDEWQPGEPVF